MRKKPPEEGDKVMFQRIDDDSWRFGEVYWVGAAQFGLLEEITGFKHLILFNGSIDWKVQKCIV